ncbi:MAG: hypothetical protein J6K41_00575 [Paraprevotella sp.]|nr:hypothetical protein [Paraprevotella sp.]
MSPALPTVMVQLCHTLWYNCAIRYGTTVPYVMIRLCHTLWYDCAIRYPLPLTTVIPGRLQPQS